MGYLYYPFNWELGQDYTIIEGVFNREFGEGFLKS